MLTILCLWGVLFFFLFLSESNYYFKILLLGATNHLNKHRKTKLNNRAVNLRVYISFSSDLRDLNFAFDARVL